MSGLDVTGKPINMGQLQDELAAASVPVPNGLGMTGPSEHSPTVELHTFDGAGEAAALPAAAEPVVEAHVAMRDKTSAEYAAEFQNPATTAARRQEIRDIQNGLLPPEQVPVEAPSPV
jgi:hypothetical protein